MKGYIDSVRKDPCVLTRNVYLIFAKKGLVNLHVLIKEAR